MPDDAPVPDKQAEESSGSKLKLIIPAIVLLLGGAGGAYVMVSGPEVTPAEKLQQALDTVGAERSAWEMRQALEIADELEELGYVDPDFPAGLSFVRGMAAFHEARQFEGEEQQRRLIAAIEHFDHALPRGMPPEHRKELTWALGVSLQTVGLSNRAHAHLQVASGYGPEGQADAWTDGRVESSLFYMQNLIDGQSEADLQEALKVNDDLRQVTDLPESLGQKIALRRAQILHLLGRRKEAGQIIANTPGENPATIILKARAVMSEAHELAEQNDKAASIDKYEDAQEILSELTGSGAPAGPAGQALFLTGLCAERLGKTESAINYYDKTTRRFGEQHEWLAASLRLGILLRESGRNEEALGAYRSVLRSVTRPEDFRNRWLTVDQFRESILNAWREWLDAKHFKEAQALTQEMAPLIDRVTALRHAAETAGRWAESAEERIGQSKLADRSAAEQQARQRWTAAGDAYAQLANEIRTEGDYPDVIRTAAEHYGRGYAFDQALEFVNTFVESEPLEGLAKSLVFKGRTLLNLDRLPEAYESLQRVITDFPTDPSVFEARLLSGRCQLERDLVDQAESTWRAILNSEELDPAANEWRLAKFEIGRLLVRRAANDFRASQPVAGTAPTDEQQTFRALAFSRWNEAIKDLRHYLERYPSSVEATEARFLLAGALQKAAIEPRERLDSALPANARVELQRDITRLLTEAIDEYRTLQTQLSEIRSTGQLDQFQQQLYRATFLQIPHAMYELSDYPDAVAHYGMVTSRFADHVSVLTAYVQRWRCFMQLRQPDDAQRQLFQARVMLNRLTDEAFQSQSTGLTREQWSEWIEWALEVHDLQNPTDNTAPAEPPRIAEATDP